MRFEPARPDERRRHPHRQVDRRLHLSPDGQKVPHRRPTEELGILSPEVRARLTARLNGESEAPASDGGASADVAEAAPPGQTALFNAWEDAVECAKCGGRMVRTGSCYTCRDCGTNMGCS
jgi:hypothetical protein